MISQGPVSPGPPCFSRQPSVIHRMSLSPVSPTVLASFHLKDCRHAANFLTPYPACTLPRNWLRIYSFLPRKDTGGEHWQKWKGKLINIGFQLEKRCNFVGGWTNIKIDFVILYQDPCYFALSFVWKWLLLPFEQQKLSPIQKCLQHNCCSNIWAWRKIFTNCAWKIFSSGLPSYSGPTDILFVYPRPRRHR